MSQSLLSALTLLVVTVAGQTWTQCNPLNSTCPDDAALGTTYSTSFNASQSEFDKTLWNVTAGSSLITFGSQGAELPITQSGDSVTVMSNFYIFWGQMEFIMKAANGTGIISTAILLSDDLDEIDWEIMGGNSTYVENNYYGWGNTSQYNAVYEPLDGAQDAFHNYTINWTQESIQYIIGGKVVRTVSSADPGQYPQTPMRVQFGIWAAGASSQEGTVQWAGGKTDFSKAPFTMYLQSLRITDGTTNSSTYSYGDKTGSYKSIKVTSGQSAAYAYLHRKSSTQQLQDNWNGLSTGAKIGIACAVLGSLAVALIAFTFYCISQRRKGRAEKAIADRAWDEQTNELLEYKRMMNKGEFAVSHLGHGERF